jgi:hypothetical protein
MVGGRWALVGWSLAALLLGGACGGEATSGGPCTPGATGMCFGLGPCTGVQLCAPDGTWGVCNCGTAPAGGSGGNVMPPPPGGSGGAWYTGGSGGIIVPPPMGGSGGIIIPVSGGSGGSGGIIVTGGTGGVAGCVDPSMPGNSGIVPADGGNFIKDWDQSGLIGPWYTYQDTGGSTIAGMYPDPNAYGPFGSNGGQMCFTGTVVATGTAYATNWGAGVGFDVCGVPGDKTFLPCAVQAAFTQPEGYKYSAGECPTRLAAIQGIEFTVTGNFGTELWVSFPTTQIGGNDPYVVIGTTGVQAVAVGATGYWYTGGAGAAPTPPEEVRAIQFQVPAGATAFAYNFCISNVTVF